MKGSRTYTSALTLLRRYLNVHDMRPSRVRNSVLQYACQLEQPFTTDQLLKACEEEHITQGTIYNALDIFVDAKILCATKRQRGVAATEYELVAPSSNRLQFTCKKCGMVKEFSDKAIARLIEERRYMNFTMQHFSLYVYGECKKCRTKVTK